MPKSGIVGSWGRLIYQFSEKLLHWLQKWLYKLALPPGMEECSPNTTSSLAWTVTCVFYHNHFDRMRWNRRVILICISLMAKDVEHFAKCFLPILVSSVGNSLFKSIFKLDCLVCWWLVFWVLYIFWILTLSEMWHFWKTFSSL